MSAPTGRRVVVVGGSGQGRQLVDVLEAMGVHEVVAVVDARLEVGDTVLGRPVVDEADLSTVAADAVAVGVGDNFVRASIVEAWREFHPDLELVSAIHPAATIAGDAVVGPGAIVMAGAVVSNGCTVGTGVLLGTKASLDHDCRVGDFVSLAPGATTGGDVRIGAYTALGLGASVIHSIAIGGHTVVGAGALVLDDLPDEVTAYGSPARVIRQRAPGEPYLHRRLGGGRDR